jgi:3-oxoacyl-[acyl-carrier protein] reductase
VSESTARFAGQTALVTGASVGIGRAICEGLLAEGAAVVTVDRHSYDGANGNVTHYEADLSQPDRTRAVAAEISSQRSIDILVNNAGVVRNTALSDVTDEEFDSLVNLHVRTAIVLAQAVLPGMKQRGYGRIINMSSRAVVGLSARTVYGATKAALVTMTRTWAMELGPFGITVNAIAPGPVLTDMLKADIPEHSERAQKLAASLPTRRLGRPEDIARAALFFASPDNGWITGQTLFVCGGASLGSSIAL